MEFSAFVKLSVICNCVKTYAAQACTDPLRFFDFDLITKATVLTLLASLTW